MLTFSETPSKKEGVNEILYKTFYPHTIDNLVDSSYAQQVDGKSIETILKNADAIQAMAVANQLKWSRKEIKSYLTPRE